MPVWQRWPVVKRSIQNSADPWHVTEAGVCRVVLPSSSLNEAALVAQRIQTNLRETAALPHAASVKKRSPSAWASIPFPQPRQLLPALLL
ncbi:hypothetical protein KCP75_05795 [Salmonella enterica subsp. enterica]|nr:hypothetical protein KCP75_05795 [Salmonella enterica subsp. enterica]